MIEAVIFDVDGVLVDSPHEEAWRRALRTMLETEWLDAAAEGVEWEAFTTAFYQEHVAGKPRLAGARDMLRVLGVADPNGHRAQQLSRRKQDILVSLVDSGRFVVFEDALRFLSTCMDCGLRVAVASSSKNANGMLARVLLPDRGVTLLDVFHANVCGRDFVHGKPHPEIFLTAAEALGVGADGCVVVEDAASGVQAAKAAGMKCIGVARVGDDELLRDAGADWVVRSLDQIDVSVVLRG
ncbi:MAG: hydrolase [Fimbriimonadales bacterium]